MSTINETIRSIRRARNLTQKELAAASGIAESALRKYEAGTLNPKKETIEKIAAGLGISPAVLIGREYPDAQYPDIVSDSDERRGLIDYLRVIGYIPDNLQHEEGCENGKETGVELMKDGKSHVLNQDEFDELNDFLKEMIRYRLWKKESM